MVGIVFDFLLGGWIGVDHVQFSVHSHVGKGLSRVVGPMYAGGSVQTAVGGEIRMNVGANTDDALLLDNTLGLHERATAPGVAAASVEFVLPLFL